MTLREHKKHADLARPAKGNFGRNEWAIVGGHCVAIKVLADQVIAALSPEYTCAYADSLHNDDQTMLPGRLANGAVLEYTDQLNNHQFNYSLTITPFKQRQLFSDADVVLVNGNHQQAKAQVVILDLSKKASLQKRINQLTNVELFLLTEHVNEPFEFIKDAIPDWEQIPIFKIDEIDKIINFFAQKLHKAKPVLNGLVLAGGKSSRMGFDKGAMDWHGKEQRYYMADLLKDLCAEVFISQNAEQKKLDAAYSVITDTFTGLGPYGAILSAFREKPDSAWLVVACDLPLLDKATLDYLVANRDTASIATAFNSEVSEFPEPLITIWEPKSYPVLLSFLAQGYSCPRKVLINTEPKLLNVPHSGALTNVNTPDELERVKYQLHPKIITA